MGRQPVTIQEVSGAVFGWGWVARNHFRYRMWIMKYWPISGLIGLKGPQVGRVPQKGLWSGHRDWTRGRHWDRRSRYGLR